MYFIFALVILGGLLGVSKFTVEKSTHPKDCIMENTADVWLALYPNRPLTALWHALINHNRSDNDDPDAQIISSCGIEARTTTTDGEMESICSYSSDEGCRVGNGATPLIIAALANRLDVLERIIEQGGNVNAVDKEYKTTALHAAAANHSLPSVTLLISKGAFVDPIDKYGFTPLHYAAQTGDTGVIAFLVKKGADVKAPTANGSSPLFLFVISHANDLPDVRDVESERAHIKQLLTPKQ